MHFLVARTATMFLSLDSFFFPCTAFSRNPIPSLTLAFALAFHHLLADHPEVCVDIPEIRCHPNPTAHEMQRVISPASANAIWWSGVNRD